MHFQFESSPANPPVTLPTEGAGGEATNELLRQLLEVQRQQLQVQQRVAEQNQGARWRAFLGRWQGEFPHLVGACRSTLPILERAFVTLVSDLTEQTRPGDGDGLENEFALMEFLDRYGQRIGQLGTILSLVAQLAEAGGSLESSNS